jgi:lipopolysaccharide transport system ATP-binding protein
MAGKPAIFFWPEMLGMSYKHVVDYAIRASEVSKTYRLYAKPVDRLLEVFSTTPRHRVFPAVQSLSFEVPAGETIGLIGENGAGKSTLLKLLCGVTAPSSGSLVTQGKISSILELGTGFHPEFTGRSNAALNATILGLSSAELRERLPEILDFSELGTFLDQPVKTYSSGMYMRLAFSVAVNVDPDILVIDEALAVGDGHFQKKCIDKIREFQQKRKTIFFCSHALYYVSTLCERAIWLENGHLRRIGAATDVVHEYEQHLLKSEKPESQIVETVDTAVRIRGLSVENGAGVASTLFTTGDDIRLRMRIDVEDPSLPLHYLLSVHRAADDTRCFSIVSKQSGLQPLRGKRSYDVDILLRNVPLLRGDYSINAFVGDENALHIYDRKSLRSVFSVASDAYELGIVAVSHSIDVDGHRVLDTESATQFATAG